MKEAKKGNGDLKGKQRSAVDTENQKEKLARKQEVAIQKAGRLIFFVPFFCILMAISFCGKIKEIKKRGKANEKIIAMISNDNNYWN